METNKKLITNTGARGAGKTILAATYCDPDDLPKVVYMDSEKSANRFREMLIAKKLPDFGKYIDLEDVQRRFGLPTDNDVIDRLAIGDTPWISDKEKDGMVDYYMYILGQIKSELPHGKYSTFILDTAEKLEAGMRAWADKNYRKLGMEKDYGKMEAGLIRPLYETILNAIWGRGVDTIIFNFHLRNVWDKATKKPIPNKVQMAGNVVLYKRSSLMLWLVNEPRNPNGEPAGLVIKERMGDIDAPKDSTGKRSWKIRRMIPPRIPICDWEHIRAYEANGYDNLHPKPEEVPSDDERDLISEFYNNKQMELMLKDMEVAEHQSMLAMKDAGLIPTATESVSIGDNGSEQKSAYPTTRGEAIVKWKQAGRPVAELVKLMQGVDDSEIAGRWMEWVTGE